MLTHFRLQNFKAWKDTGGLRLAPITVFFGNNSSGKSSLGQFLLMLRRTVEQPDRNLVFHTSDDRNPVDLGSYYTYVHNHDEKLNIEFRLDWLCPDPILVNDSLHERRIDVTSLAFCAVIGTSGTRLEQVVCKELTYRLNPSNDSASAVITMDRKGDTNKYQLATNGFEAVRNPGRVWPLPEPAKFYGFPDELYAYYQNVADFGVLQLGLETTLRGIQYLGPLRQYPRREYTWTGQTPGDVGFQGENTISLLLASADREIKLKGKKSYQPVQLVVAEWLKRMGVVEDFRLSRISKESRSYRVRLKMRGRPTEMALPDVGFGVSQVLPVVTAAFCAPANTTVIIEQPELHLHPAVQNILADSFVDAIHTRENGIARNVQFLIESHSEHFLRRLQRRVAEGSLRPSEIAVYFCELPSAAVDSRIRPLEVDLYGRIANWPDKFFGDQLDDIAAIRKEGLKREIAAKAQSTTNSRLETE